jgi:hypothetical protein
MKKFFNELLSSGITHRISSKRVCGILGWLTILILIILSTLYGLEIPSIADTFLFCCMGLLGIESVTAIWNKPKNNNFKEEEL